jgi:hypothetical protein
MIAVPVRGQTARILRAATLAGMRRLMDDAQFPVKVIWIQEATPIRFTSDTSSAKFKHWPRLARRVASARRKGVLEHTRVTPRCVVSDASRCTSQLALFSHPG